MKLILRRNTSDILESDIQWLMDNGKKAGFEMEIHEWACSSDGIRPTESAVQFRHRIEQLPQVEFISELTVAQGISLVMGARKAMTDAPGARQPTWDYPCATTFTGKP